MEKDTTALAGHLYLSSPQFFRKLSAEDPGEQKLQVKFILT